MQKVAYSPAEFAEVFGRERTWGYRQLYAGKVRAITKLGRTMIPASEVDRLLAEAGRYLGAGVGTGELKTKSTGKGNPPAKTPPPASGSTNWQAAIQQRKKSGAPAAGKAARTASSAAHYRLMKRRAS